MNALKAGGAPASKTKRAPVHEQDASSGSDTEGSVGNDDSDETNTVSGLHVAFLIVSLASKVVTPLFRILENYYSLYLWSQSRPCLRLNTMQSMLTSVFGYSGY